MAKHRTSLNSERLMRVYRAIKESGRRGIGIIDLMIQANVTDPKDCVHELKYAGVEIESEWHESMNGRRYKLYFLTEKVSEVA